MSIISIIAIVLLAVSIPYAIYTNYKNRIENGRITNRNKLGQYTRIHRRILHNARTVKINTIDNTYYMKM